MSLPSPPRCILNGGHFVHPCFRCFFNLELRTSVHQTLGSISLWSLAYSNQFQTCCAGVCFSGWAVRAEIQKLKKKSKPKPSPTKKNQQKPSTPRVEALMNKWFAHIQYILKGKQENKSSHLFEALTGLCQQCSEEIWLPLCWISSSFSRLLESHFSLPQLAQTLFSLLTPFVLSKVDPDWPWCYYNWCPLAITI